MGTLALRVLPVVTLLTGLVLLLAPGAGRPGELFGVRLGSAAGGREARRIVLRYRAGVGLATLACLALQLALGARARHAAGLATPYVALVLAGWTLVLRAWARTRALAGEPAGSAPQPAGPAPAPVGAKVPAIAWIALISAVSGGLFSLLYAWWRYAELPPLVPAHFGFEGFPDRWVGKSPGAVFMIPAMALVVGTLVSLMSVAVAHAKAGTGRVALPPEAQRRYQRAISSWIAGVSLVTTALLVTLSYQMVGVGLARRDRLSFMPLFLGVLLAYSIGGGLWLLVRYGQGGSKLASGASAPDPRRVLGVLYVDRADPALVVERRVGPGFTPNFGNPRALLLFGGLGLLLVAVALLTMLAP